MVEIRDDVVIVPITTAQRKILGNQIPGSVRMIMDANKIRKIYDSS